MNRYEYNGTDCIATHMLLERLRPELNEETQRVYEAEIGLQGVALGVQMRGILIDPRVADSLVAELESEANRAVGRVEGIVGYEMTGEKGNISTQKLHKWLYQELQMRPQKNKDGEVTTDKDALRRFAKRTVPVLAEGLERAERTRRKDAAATACGLILEIRDKQKQISRLRTPRRDGRMRGTFNVGGTETYRLSSHKAHTGEGTNLMNEDKRLRRAYVPDPGFTMFQGDQERAESLTVAHVSGDEAYIEAHYAGNTHVFVGRMIWPELDWPDDDEAARLFAAQTPIPGLDKVSAPDGPGSLYYTSKRVQHGQNNGGSFQTVARSAMLSIQQAKDVCGRYHEQFPGIKRWHKSVAEAVRNYGVLHYPGGYMRRFFDRRWDPATHREAIASVPQSIIAWTNHIVWSRLFYQWDDNRNRLVLAHGHDAVLGQFRAELDHDAEIARMNELARVEWDINGRTMVVPWDWHTGANWKEVS